MNPRPIEGVERAAVVPTLLSLRTAVASLAVGTAVALVAPLLPDGTPLARVAPLSAGGVAALATAGALAAFAALRVRRGEVRLTREGIVLRDGGFRGETREIPYESVDLAVRRETLGDAWAGTASFEILRSGAENAVLAHVRDPGAVERVLDERVPGPAERNEMLAAESDEVRPIEDERSFWRHWSSFESLPDTAVVAAETYDQSLVEPPSTDGGDGGGVVYAATTDALAHGDFGHSPEDPPDHGDPLTGGAHHHDGATAGGFDGDGGGGGCE